LPQGISRADLTNISPEARVTSSNNSRFPLRTDVHAAGRSRDDRVAGFHGGALWGGASFVSDTEWLYVNHNEIPWSTSLLDAKKGAGFRYDFSGYKRNVDQTDTR
jgi:hypothetical protein